MISTLHNHLKFSNLVALLALFIALGGTSYAVTQLPKGSVGSTQLKKNAVTSKKVKDRSLLARDFKAGQLASTGVQGPAGPAGPPGSPGPRGPAGVAGLDVAYGEIVYSEPGGLDEKSTVVDCPGDSRPVGAGLDGPASTQNAGGVEVPGWWVAGQGPVKSDGIYAGAGAAPTGWKVEVVRKASAIMTIRVRVLCAAVA